MFFSVLRLRRRLLFLLLCRLGAAALLCLFRLAGLCDWSAASDCLLVTCSRTRGAAMQSREVGLGEGVPEGLTLLGGEQELLGSGLTRAVAASEGTGTPGRAGLC